MSTSPESQTRWLDFSGAPSILIPQSLAVEWRGIFCSDSSEYWMPGAEPPVSDYDRVCDVARQGNGILEFNGVSIPVLRSEFDLHSWDANHQILACGGWFASEDEIRRATWTNPIRWHAKHTDYMLMNPTADGEDLRDDEFMPVRLPSGLYTIEYADIESEYAGIFHRFVRDDHAAV